MVFDASPSFVFQPYFWPSAKKAFEDFKSFKLIGSAVPDE